MKYKVTWHLVDGERQSEVCNSFDEAVRLQVEKLNAGYEAFCQKHYTKTWMICYNYGGFATAFIPGDTIEDAIKQLHPSAEYIKHSLYAEFTSVE